VRWRSASSAQFVPILALALALLGGALAGAFDRRRLMIAADPGSLAVIVALCANALLPDPRLWAPPARRWATSRPASPRR
jgi:hypothetical protein